MSSEDFIQFFFEVLGRFSVQCFLVYLKKHGRQLEVFELIGDIGLDWRGKYVCVRWRGLVFGTLATVLVH